MKNNKHPVSTEENGQAGALAWKAMVVKFQKPSTWRALWQIVNTLGPYALLWYLMYRSVTVSWSIALAILAGGFLVRIFIIHHDCGHGSFFKSRKSNDILGYITGGLAFTPHYHWRWEHAAPQSTSLALDRQLLLHHFAVHAAC